MGLLKPNSRDGWTNTSVEEELKKSRDISVPFVRSFFDWSEDETTTAINAAATAIERYLPSVYNGQIRLPPPNGSDFSKRTLAVTDMINANPGIFTQRSTFSEAWFEQAFVNADSSNPGTGFLPVTHRWLAAAWGLSKRKVNVVEKKDKQEQEASRGKQHARDNRAKRERSVSVNSEDTVSRTRRRLDTIGLQSPASRPTTSISVMEDVQYAQLKMENIPLLFGFVEFRDDTITIHIELVSTNSIRDPGTEGPSIQHARKAARIVDRKDQSIWYFKGAEPWPADTAMRFEGAMAYQSNLFNLKDRPFGIEMWIAPSDPVEGPAYLRRIPPNLRNIAKQSTQTMEFKLTGPIVEIEDGSEHASPQPQSPIQSDVAPSPEPDASSPDSAVVETDVGLSSEPAAPPPGSPVAEFEVESTLPLSAVVSPNVSNTGAFTENPMEKKEPASKTPLVSLPYDHTFTQWMSSSADEASAEPGTNDNAPLSAAEYMQSHIKATHITKKNWLSFTKFVRFASTVGDPRAQLVLEGWSKTKQLRTYQFFAGTKMLRDVCRGQIYNINALDMGLGKTPSSLFTLYAHIQLRAQYELRQNPAVPSCKTSVALPNRADLISQSQFGDIEDLVGREPVIQRGANLIIVPANLVTHWAKELKSFIDDKRIKVVVAHGGEKWPKSIRAEYPGCYHPCDEISLRSGDLPSMSDLRQYGGSDFAKRIEETGSITVRELLNVGAQCLAPWLDEWIVICGRQGASNYVGRTPNARYGIDTTWALVLIDEFHSVKSTHGNEFGVLRHLRGYPSFLFISATPYNLPADLSYAYIASHARYFTIKEGNKQAKRSFDTFTQSDWMTGDLVEYNEDLEEHEIEELEKASFKQVWSAAQEVAKSVKKTAVTSKQDDKLDDKLDDNQDDNQDDNLLDFGANAAPPSFLTAINKIASWLRPRIIQFDGDLMWCPNEDGKRFPAIDIPPHSTFDIPLWVEENYAPAVAKFWRTTYAAAGGKNGASKGSKKFLGAIEKMNVVLSFPCLPSLMEQSDALRDEIADFKSDDIKTFDDRAAMRETELWKVMHHIHALPSMKTAVEIIRQARDAEKLPNCAKMGHKIIVVSIKPFNAYIFDMYMAWLEEQPPGSVLWQPEDTSVDMVYINTKESGYAQKNRVKAARFSCGNPKPELYEDKPFLMNAVGSQIRTGLSLPPADIIIMLDGTYQPEIVQQMGGRVRRNGLVQLNERTWCFRLQGNCKQIPLGQWQADKHASQAELQANVANAHEEMDQPS